MSGVVETVEVDPTQAVGRLLPEGWRVERTFAYDGGTILASAIVGTDYSHKRVPHGETVTVVAECTPEDCAWTPSQACCENQSEWYCEGDAIGYPYAGICTPDKPIHNEPCGWLPLPADVDAATRQAVQ